MKALFNLGRKHNNSYRYTTRGSQPVWAISVRPYRNWLMMHSAGIYYSGGIE